MNAKRNDNKVKTYCYGKLREFRSVKEAMDFYLDGCAACESAERDRYLDIYSKLACGTEPYCDCDGIPVETNEKESHVLTDEDERTAREILKRKREAGEELDALRAKYNALKEEFERKNAALVSDIRNLSEEYNDLACMLVKLQKLGFRA